MKKLAGILVGLAFFLCAVVAQAQCTLGEALDATDLTWETGGAASWFCQTIGPFTGNSSAQSGDIDDNQTTWLQTTVTVDTQKVVSFYWKTSADSGDSLRFSINGGCLCYESVHPLFRC